MKRTLTLIAFLAAGLMSSSVITQPVVAQDDAQEKASPELLTIGSKAPALDVEFWVQNGEGSFKEVTEFKPGNVYIVEFWATWCGPCIASMPHIVETQEKYKDRGVQVISISDEPLETVEKFLERDVRGEEDMTYKQLTSSYCLTTDPDGSSSEDYMRAAGRNGIPCAFIVGKSGLVEWIGHPMAMDEPLEAVVEGQWDREAFAKEFRAEQEIQAFTMKLGRTFRRDPAAAMEMLDKKMQDAPELADRLMVVKLQILLQTEADEKEIAPAALKVLATMKDEPMAVNNLAWNLYEMAESGQFKDKEFLGKLADISAEAAGNAPKDAAWQVWDTAGHLYYAAGNLDKAIAAQQKAVDSPNSSEAPEVAEFLKSLKEEK